MEGGGVQGTSVARTPCRLDKLLSHTTGGVATGYTYDAAGRPTLVGASRLHYWTYEGEMSSIWNAGAPGYKDSFAYNGLSTRVSKTEQARLMPPTPGTTTTFVRDGVGVTAPVVKDTFATYTPGVSERRAGVSTFSHSGIKNHEAQSGSAQTISATREYDAFGNLTSSSGTWSGAFSDGPLRRVAQMEGHHGWSRSWAACSGMCMGKLGAGLAGVPTLKPPAGPPS